MHCSMTIERCEKFCLQFVRASFLCVIACISYNIFIVKPLLIPTSELRSSSDKKVMFNKPLMTHKNKSPSA